ncbi:MAG: hypothetical protein EOP55_10845, partial [Sphingobacteriales bacterium]
MNNDKQNEITEKQDIAVSDLQNRATKFIDFWLRSFSNTILETMDLLTPCKRASISVTGFEVGLN